MNRLFLFRLGLDLLAVSLLLAAYAYNGLGNAAHEVIGTVMFGLLITHNVFNRRWYGTITKGRRDARGAIAKAINLSLLAAMLSLLVTSVIISQTVFSFLPIASSVTARQAHTFAAYAALLVVALHLGLQWSMIMELVRIRLRLRAGNPVRAWALRAVAVLIAAYGIHSLMAVNIASKLSMRVPEGFSDFQMPAPALLFHHLAIVVLGVSIIHGSLKLVRTLAAAPCTDQA